MSTILVGAIQIVASMVVTGIVEKFGRKPLLIFSDLFVCLSMIAVGIFFKMYENCSECHTELLDPLTNQFNGSLTNASKMVSESTIYNISWVPLVGLMVFVFTFMIGLGPLPWVMNVELMPPEARVSTSPKIEKCVIIIIIC